MVMPPPSSKPREPIYIQLANGLEELIRDKSLRPGDRLPSVRRFSVQQRVSVPTAMQAFATLETRGVIEARPKSGFYVRATRSTFTPEPTATGSTLKVTDFASHDPIGSLLLDQTNSKLVPLGAALPGADLLPGVKLARIMASVCRKMGDNSVRYDVVPGSEVMRHELSRYSLEWGCRLKADDFILTHGATEAVSLALRVTCQPGDTVVVESPTYFGFARMLRELGLKALAVPVDTATGMDLDVLEKALRRRRVSAALLIPNFHNPVGFTMPDTHKLRLVQMLSARGIPIIEDDIYGDMQHHGPRPSCIKSFDQDGSVILCSSFSKTLAPGYRVGYMSSGRWHAPIAALKRATTLSGSTLPTLAIAEFLRNGGYDRYLRSVRQSFRQQVDRMREAIVESFPEDIALTRPQGSFILWCELPVHVDSVQLAKEARAAGISIAPGPLFSPDGGFRHFIRINCGCRWNKEMERAVTVLGHLVKRTRR